MKAIINLLMVCCIAVGTTSCSSDDDDERSRKNFVLIAGSWQGAWVWDDVKDHLESAGHNVSVVELPAHGTDQTPPQSVSMDVYRDKAIAQINGIPGQVILVGHSMAGMIISAVSEEIPDRIEELVYVGAMLPANGQSLLDLASTDMESLLTPSIIPSEDQLLLDVVHDKITDIFCQDCSFEAKQLILDKFRLEPAIPFTNKVMLSEDGFAKVKKNYIHTELDHAITIGLQNRMVAAAGNVNVHSLRSSHSPQLSMPRKLSALLIRIAHEK